MEFFGMPANCVVFSARMVTTRYCFNKSLANAAPDVLLYDVYVEMFRAFSVPTGLAATLLMFPNSNSDWMIPGNLC